MGRDQTDQPLKNFSKLIRAVLWNGSTGVITGNFLLLSTRRSKFFMTIDKTIKVFWTPIDKTIKVFSSINDETIKVLCYNPRQDDQKISPISKTLIPKTLPNTFWMYLWKSQTETVATR